MPLDVGRVTHLIEQMHRSEDDAGDPIDAGMVLVSDGARGFTWEEHGANAFIDLGNLGATETLDVSSFDWFAGTLNANCAITVSGFVDDTGKVVIVQLTQDGTGGWDVTWDADIEFSGDDQPDQTASSVTFFTLWSAEGDSTIYGAKVGSASSLTPAATVEDETTLGITPAVGTDLEYARQDHTHGSPDTDAIKDAGRWEHAVIPGSPPDDLYADGDWLYIWVP